jgi:hypothetical protein
MREGALEIPASVHRNVTLASAGARLNTATAIFTAPAQPLSVFDFGILPEHFFLQLLAGIVAQFFDNFMPFVFTDCRIVEGVTFAVSRLRNV